MVNLRIGPNFRLSFFPFWKAGGLQIRCCQGLAVAYYGCALGGAVLWSPPAFATIG
jgi:hypothetical protein